MSRYAIGVTVTVKADTPGDAFQAVADITAVYGDPPLAMGLHMTGPHLLADDESDDGVYVDTLGGQVTYVEDYEHTSETPEQRLARVDMAIASLAAHRAYISGAEA